MTNHPSNQDSPGSKSDSSWDSDIDGSRTIQINMDPLNVEKTTLEEVPPSGTSSQKTTLEEVPLSGNPNSKTISEEVPPSGADDDETDKLSDRASRLQLGDEASPGQSVITPPEHTSKQTGNPSESPIRPRRADERHQEEMLKALADKRSGKQPVEPFLQPEDFVSCDQEAILRANEAMRRIDCSRVFGGYQATAPTSFSHVTQQPSRSGAITPEQLAIMAQSLTEQERRRFAAMTGWVHQGAQQGKSAFSNVAAQPRNEIDLTGEPMDVESQGQPIKSSMRTPMDWAKPAPPAQRATPISKPTDFQNLQRLSGSSSSKIKVSAPNKYDGRDKKKAEDFLQQAELYFTLAGVTTEIEKVSLFLSWLVDDAWSWGLNMHRSPEFQARPKFTVLADAFLSQFASSQRRLQALDRLRTPQGNRDLQSYILDFKNAVQRYNNLCQNPTDRVMSYARTDQFMTGLNNHYAELLQDSGFLFTEDTELEEITKKLIEIDSSNKRFSSYRKSRDKSENYRDKKNKLFGKSNRRRLRDDEKVDDDKKSPIICNRCKKPGHKAAECKSKDPWHPDNKGPPCKHCKKHGHEERDCWIKHPDKKPKRNKRVRKEEDMEVDLDTRITKRTKRVIAQTSPARENGGARSHVTDKIKNDKVFLINNVSAAGRSGKTPLDKFSIKILLTNKEFPINCLVDSGCPFTIIRRDIADQLEIKCVKDPLGTKLAWGNGDPCGNSGQYITEPIAMQIGQHIETISFHVITDGEEEIMLGYDWLYDHNPSINWRTGELAFTDPNCVRNCTNETAIDLDEVPELQNKRILGMMQIPREDGDKSLQHYLVACQPNRDKTFRRILKVRTNASPSLDECDRAVNGESKEYYILTIKHDEVRTISQWDDYHDVEEAFKEMTEEDVKRMPSEYHEYMDVFSKKAANRLAEHRPYDLAIELTDDFKPKWGPLYNLSEEEMTLLKEYIDSMLEKGFIRPSTSPCGAPVLFVPKPKGRGLRLCVDYRALNSVTKKNRYPLPLIDNLLERLKSAKVYTALDLKGAYNLVRIKEGDEWKTAFRTRYGHYEYVVVPFGLTNAPATFQGMMNDIFKEHLDVFVIVYLDDILIFSENGEEHFEHVKTVLQLLRQNDLYCEFEKCIFHSKEVEFLGYVVSGDGIIMSQTKVDSILEWEVPKNRIDVMSFLGFANYYRRFVRDFARIAGPLHNLTKKEDTFVWTSEAQSAFEALKHAFVSAPILRYADFAKPFVLETDASNFAMGCILSQHFDGVLHPVAYYSKKFSGSELRWEIHDKELFGIITALRHWRHYLVASQFPIEIYTDHKNLEYFMTKQKLNQRQLRWTMFLADYDFKIMYKQGRLMGKADALSRRHEYKAELLEDKQRQRIVLDKKRLEPEIFDQLEAARLQEDESTTDTILRVLPHVPQGGSSRIATVSVLENKHQLYSLIAAATPSSLLFKQCLENKAPKHFTLRSGIVYYKTDRAVVPDKECQLNVLKHLHDLPTAGHFGESKTLDRVRKEFYWPGMEEVIRHYVASCDICQRTKKPKHKPYGLLKPLPIPQRPWSDIAMDFAVLPVSEGFNMVFTVICRLTRQVHFIAAKDTLSAAELADLFFDRVVKYHGVPSTIVSDRGTLFTSHYWQSFTRALAITHNLSTAHHQQSDGATERVIQTLKTYLRAFVNYQQDNWMSYLALAEFAYNNATHASTGISPFMANYGFDFNLSPVINTEDSVPAVGERLSKLASMHSKLQDAAIKSQIAMKRNADKRRMVPPSFAIGDSVW